MKENDDMIVPWLQLSLPVSVEDLLLSRKSCNVFIIVIYNVEDLEGVFYFGAWQQFLNENYFLILAESQNIDIEELMKFPIMKNSHLLAVLLPINDLKYAAYRSTLQVDEKTELFAVLGREGFKEEIFNEKLTNFHGSPTKNYVVNYPPNVVVTKDENGVDHYEGFEIDIFNELAKAVNSKVIYYSNPEPYNFETQMANVSGKHQNYRNISIQTSPT